MPDWKSLLTNTIDTPLKRVLRAPLLPFDDKKLHAPVSNDAQLQSIANKLRRGGMAADLYDENWHLVWASEELQLMLGEENSEKLGIGKHLLENLATPTWKSIIGAKSFLTIIEAFNFCSKEEVEAIETKGWNQKEIRALEKRKKETFPKQKLLYENTPVDLLQTDLPPVRVWCHSFTLLNGYHANIYSPGLRASVLSLVSRGNPTMFEQMLQLFEPSPHQSAIIFLDIAGSTHLGKIMPSEAYFALLSNVARAIDDALLRHGGIVGKHVGDGAVGFTIDDQDADGAVRKALCAAIDAQKAVKKISEQLNKELDNKINLQLNGAIHFSQNLYMGQMVTGGRLEVTALGEEVNGCARMLEGATDGKLLLSKAFCEKIKGNFSYKNTKIDASSLVYQTLDEFSISDKSKKDSGYLSVYCL